MKSFELDQEVNVTNPDHVYSTFSTMFKKLGFKNKRRNYPDNIKGVVFRVFAVDVNPHNPKVKLYAIHSVGKPNNELLVNGDALILNTEK